MTEYTNSLTNHTSENYLKHGSFVYSLKHSSPIMELLDPRPNQNIVDLGPGTGQLTERIKEAVGPRGQVWGIDSSQDMLNHAKMNGDKLGIHYIRGDIQDHTTLDPALEGAFDTVFSSATFHWCKRDPGGVIETIKWLLRPGGRAVFEFGGFGNTLGVRAALHEVVRRHGGDPITADPWYFPTADQYSALLSERGMERISVGLFPRPTALTTDIVGWLKTFAQKTFMADFSEEEACRMMQEVSEMCRPDAFWCDATPGIGAKLSGDPSCNGNTNSGWEIMYVRLRGEAFKKDLGDL